MVLKSQSQVARVVALAVFVLLEALALLSIVLRSTFLPMLGPIYPNVASVAVYLLPMAVGVFCRRLENAILLAVLPFVVLVGVYLAVAATPWIVDLSTLGDLAGRIAGPMVLFGGSGLLGWLVRQSIFNGLSARALRKSAK